MNNLWHCPDTVIVNGKHRLSSYIRAVELLVRGIGYARIYAAGRCISLAVDVAEVARSRFSGLRSYVEL